MMMMRNNKRLFHIPICVLIRFYLNVIGNFFTSLFLSLKPEIFNPVTSILIENIPKKISIFCRSKPINICYS